MKLFIPICCLTVWSCTFSQDWKDVDEKEVQEIYTRLAKPYYADQYVVTFSKDIYLFEGDTVFMHDSGQLYKGTGSDYSLCSDAADIVQQNNLKAVKVPDQKTVYLSDPDSNFRIVNLDSLFLHLDRYLFAMKNFGDTQVLKAYSRNQVSFRETEIYFANGAISKVVMRMVSGNYYQTSLDDTSEESPVMIMTYSRPSKIEESKKYLLRSDRLVQVVDGKYKLSSSLSGSYELVDLRGPKSSTTRKK